MNIEELLYEQESAILDFKQEQYPFIGEKNEHKKSELLKDILAFANAWRRDDAYILIGVEEVKGQKSVVLGIDSNLDDATLQQFINSKTQKPLSFEYKNIRINNKNVGVIKIGENERPIYVKKDYGKVKKNIVYIRRGSSTDEASPDEIVDMGKSLILEKCEPILELSFSNNGEKLALENKIKINTTFLEIPKINEIPDYEKKNNSNSNFNLHNSFELENKDYYRELCEYHYIKTCIYPLSFCLKNISPNIANDIRIEILVVADRNIMDILYEKDIPKRPERFPNHLDRFHKHINSSKINLGIKKEVVGNMWHINIYFNKVQAKDTSFTRDNLYFIFKKEAEINFKYKIFADELSSPIEGVLTINNNLKLIQRSYLEIEEIERMKVMEKFRAKSN